MNDSGSMIGTIGAIIYFVVIFGLIAFFIVAQWKIFEKAGKPGWAAIVPIYNLIVLCEVVGRPAWWVLLAFCTGPIFQILISMDLAERFGQEKNWGLIWLFLLAPIGYYKLAFDDSFTYSAPSGSAAG